MKQTLIKFQGKIDKVITVFRDVSNHFSIIEMTSRQKIKNIIGDLNNSHNKLNLIMSIEYDIQL